MMVADEAGHKSIIAMQVRISELEAENKLLRQQREAHMEVISRAKACFACGERVLKGGK